MLRTGSKKVYITIFVIMILSLFSFEGLNSQNKRIWFSAIPRGKDAICIGNYLCYSIIVSKDTLYFYEVDAPYSFSLTTSSKVTMISPTVFSVESKKESIDRNINVKQQRNNKCKEFHITVNVPNITIPYDLETKIENNEVVIRIIPCNLERNYSSLLKNYPLFYESPKIVVNPYLKDITISIPQLTDNYFIFPSFNGDYYYCLPNGDICFKGIHFIESSHLFDTTIELYKKGLRLNKGGVIYSRDILSTQNSALDDISLEGNWFCNDNGIEYCLMLSSGIFSLFKNQKKVSWGLFDYESPNIISLNSYSTKKPHLIVSKNDDKNVGKDSVRFLFKFPYLENEKDYLLSIVCNSDLTDSLSHHYFKLKGKDSVILKLSLFERIIDFSIIPADYFTNNYPVLDGYYYGNENYNEDTILDIYYEYTMMGTEKREIVYNNITIQYNISQKWFTDYFFEKDQVFLYKNEIIWHNKKFLKYMSPSPL